MAGKTNERTLMRLDEDLWLGSSVDKPIDDDYYLNHSRDPNLWITEAIKMTARRGIVSGEEVTMDYATHFADPVLDHEEQLQLRFPELQKDNHWQ